MKTAELLMSLAGTGLLACLCMLLLFRRFHREFRFFTLCMLLSVISTVALILVRNHSSLYFAIYWPLQALGLVTVFFALQEAFHLVFRNFYVMPWFRWLFPAVGILMITIAIIRAAFYPVSEIGLVGAGIISLEIAVGLLQVGIFALFVVLVRFFHMGWRQHAFGVVLGFGISAAGELLVYLLRSEFGTKFNPVVRITPPLAYIAAVMVWLATFLRAEPSQTVQKQPPSLTPEEMASEMRRYTRAVKGLLER
jgi:hypothetical protein